MSKGLLLELERDLVICVADDDNEEVVEEEE